MFKCTDPGWERFGVVSGRNRRHTPNSLGISVDTLIDGFIQTVLSVIAIDKMANNLVDDEGNFNVDMFTSLNKDEGLLRELKIE